MENVTKGALAGLAGTVALSALMVMKEMMGLMPELNVIRMLAGMTGTSPIVGWLIHFAIGALAWGGIFAILNASIPGGNQVVKGIVLGLVAWLAMMLVVMPMAGQGLFGVAIGPAAPIMTAVLHVVFGAVMGWVYAAQISTPVHA